MVLLKTSSALSISRDIFIKKKLRKDTLELARKDFCEFIDWTTFYIFFVNL